jgi:hypothetical protein
MMLHCLHSAILTTGRTTHGTTTSALPGIIAARSLQPSVAGFYGPGVYLTSSRTKAVAWARFRAATAARQFVASDRDSYEMEWRNVDRVHKQQERLPEGRVHVIGHGYIPNSNFVDEPGARPVLVAVYVRLGKCKTFDAVLRDADYFYWSFHGFYRGGVFIPALRERDARLRGGGPYCPFHTGSHPDYDRVPTGPDRRPPPEFEVLVSDELGRLTMQEGPKCTGSAWFRRANGVDGWLREGFDHGASIHSTSQRACQVAAARSAFIPMSPGGAMSS